jgi:predicted ATPase
MRIERLEINNFKSLRNISIKNPNAFTVFAGANASGKSNIFEALELFSFVSRNTINYALKVFGSYNDLLCRQRRNNNLKIDFKLETDEIDWEITVFEPKIDLPAEAVTSGMGPIKSLRSKRHSNVTNYDAFSFEDNEPDAKIFSQEFSRLFLNNTKISRQKYLDDSRLDFYGSNLEKVLKRLMLDNNFREELTEILSLWIPGLENILVQKDSITGNDILHFYESGSKKPYPKSLISDGTINIITLLVAIYQTDKPQFLCIEEPENGLNPKVITELVELIRQRVKETGQHIWLSTHSETLVSALKPEELILVDKTEGYTTIRQFQDINLHGLPLEKAWLSNVLGGGLPW